MPKILFCPRGQILIPSLMIFPALILFAILIVEVAKLSQQKILMQFAMDTSVFMEASQASDAANRLAYLNAAWPTRVFEEPGGLFDDVNEINPSQNVKPWQVLCKNGVYPHSDSGEKWDGQFGHPACPQALCQRSEYQDDCDGVNQRINGANFSQPQLNPLYIFIRQDFEDYGPMDASLVFESEDASLYNRIYRVYSYLNTLASMVANVYTRLHNIFFRKTFWLNTGFNPPANLVYQKWFESPDQVFRHTNEYLLWYTRNTGPGGAPEYYRNPSNGTGPIVPPMWQLATLEQLRDDNRATLNFGRYRYEGPPNTFGVSYRDLFNGMDPYVTASAEIRGGRVWPYPRPKFQVLLRP